MTRDDAAAHEAIRQTIAGYTIAGDSRDAEAFKRLWADDAILEFAGFPPVPGFRRQGIEEIRAATGTWSPEPGKDPSLTLTSFIRHNLTTCQIELTGPDTARAKTYFMVMTEIGLDHSGSYTDKLVLRDGKWLFSHRHIMVDWRSPVSAFPPLPDHTATLQPDPHQANVDLMNRYAHALDVRDWDLFASLFTEDAEFFARQYEENAVPGEDFMTLSGRDAIVASLRGVWDGLSATHHNLSNHVVDVSADRRSARISCYLRAHHVGNRERSDLFEESLGRFDFQTELVGSDWKIRRMDENIFVILGTEEAFAPV